MKDDKLRRDRGFMQKIGKKTYYPDLIYNCEKVKGKVSEGDWVLGIGNRNNIFTLHI